MRAHAISQLVHRASDPNCSKFPERLSIGRESCFRGRAQRHPLGAALGVGVAGAFYATVGTHALHVFSALGALAWGTWALGRGRLGRDGLRALRLYAREHVACPVCMGNADRPRWEYLLATAIMLLVPAVALSLLVL